MHEGKHGILDGVDDMDDIFGTKEEQEEGKDHDHDHDPGHAHDKDQAKKPKDAHKPHASGGGCNCG